MAYTISGTDLMQVISSLNLRDADNDEALLRRLLRINQKNSFIQDLDTDT